MNGSAAQLRLQTPVEELPHVGPRRAAAFRRLGVATLADLIKHLPHRHERIEPEAPIARLAAGAVVSARGEITATRVVNRRPRPRFEAVLLDPTGRLDLVFFNQTFLQSRLRVGMRIRVQGTAKRFHSGLQIANPKWEVLTDEGEAPADALQPEGGEARLRPVYPASEDLPSSAIEKTVLSVLDAALPQIDDHLPDTLRVDRALPVLREAYRMFHRPADEEEVRAARRRLAYDELLLLQLGVQMKRAYVRRTRRAPALRWSEAIDGHIRARFPFPLTEAQDVVVREVAADLQRPTPTSRLVQGDVGSGKTVIALYAMLMSAASRHQSALMAPTELLAEQHFASISRYLAGSSVKTALLTGGLPEAERRAVHEGLASGEIDMVVGTHALLSAGVRFASLAVAVIDEQHRFGVHQRMLLREGGEGGAMPHTLVMTATPIPRTLALTVFGDLDVSTVRGMPPGRSPIRTRWVPGDKSAEVYAWLRTRLDRGEQAYIVVPAIDGGEAEDPGLLTDAPPAGGDRERSLKSVRSVLRHLEEGPLAGKRLASLHGRMGREQRDAVMERFRAGAIDALVATTVIEVGVDVSNATVMVIEHAERFGLAQLHQLRGRVGRGSKASVCVLIGDAPTPEAGDRMKAVAEQSDGFVLAERDLELRGPGEILGARQAGAAQFSAARFPEDTNLLLLARRDAAAWIDKSPTLGMPEEALVRARLMRSHGEALGLGDIA
ncbi:MAG: ATP-dependent DNA helicase RecG [Phycisphaerales bacterium]|nr:ATP-dependent DNA helicase RecG [Phycisphaerales bacterium]